MSAVIRSACRAVILLLLLPLTSPLFGQDFFQVRDRILMDHWKRLGPIYLTPRLLIRNLGYSDNIYQYGQFTEGDWTLDLGLQLQGDLLVGRRLILSYQVMPEYHLFARNSELSNWTVAQSLGLHSYLGPFNIRVNAVANQSWGAPNPEYGLSIRYKTSGGDAQISLGNPNYFSLLFNAGQTDNEFEDLRYLGEYDLSRFNYRLRSAGLGLGFRIFTRTQLQVRYQRQWLGYKVLAELDADLDQLGMTLILPELSSLRGTLTAGMQRYTPRNGRYNRLETPYGSGSIIFQPGRRWRLLLGYQVRTQDSFNQVDLLFVQNSWNLGYDLYLTRRWRIGYRFNDNNLQYRLRSAVETIQRREHYQMHGAQLAFRIFEKTAIGLTWSRIHTVETSSPWPRNNAFIGGYLETDF
jgi:hypothetical protein